MLKNRFRALVVVTAFAVPCMSFGANSAFALSAFHASVSQMDPTAPVPDPVFKKKGSASLDPTAPVPDPVFKKKGSASLDPTAPVPDPVFKKKGSTSSN